MKGYFSYSPDSYVCVAVPEPFIINDINKQSKFCPDYTQINEIDNETELCPNYTHFPNKDTNDMKESHY